MVSCAVRFGPGEIFANAAAAELCPSPWNRCQSVLSHVYGMQLQSRPNLPHADASSHQHKLLCTPRLMSSRLCDGAHLTPRLCRLKFDRNDSIPLELQLESALDVPNLRCLPVVSSGDGNAASLRTVSLDSAYWSYQYCQCLPGLVSAPADPYIVNNLWRIRCVPEAPASKSMSPAYVVAGVINWGGVAIIIATVIYFCRRWGPPRVPTRSSR